MSIETFGFLAGNFFALFLISFISTWLLSKFFKERFTWSCIIALFITLLASTSPSVKVESSAFLFYLRGITFALAAQYISFLILRKKSA